MEEAELLELGVSCLPTVTRAEFSKNSLLEVVVVDVDGASVLNAGRKVEFGEVAV